MRHPLEILLEILHHLEAMVTGHIPAEKHAETSAKIADLHKELLATQPAPKPVEVASAALPLA